LAQLSYRTGASHCTLVTTDEVPHGRGGASGRLHGVLVSSPGRRHLGGYDACEQESVDRDVSDTSYVYIYIYCGVYIYIHIFCIYVHILIFSFMLFIYISAATHDPKMVDVIVTSNFLVNFWLPTSKRLRTTYMQRTHQKKNGLCREGFIMARRRTMAL